MVRFRKALRREGQPELLLVHGLAGNGRRQETVGPSGAQTSDTVARPRPSADRTARLSRRAAGRVVLDSTEHDLSTTPRRCRAGRSRVVDHVFFRSPRTPWPRAHETVARRRRSTREAARRENRRGLSRGRELAELSLHGIRSDVQSRWIQGSRTGGYATACRAARRRVMRPDSYCLRAKAPTIPP